MTLFTYLNEQFTTMQNLDFCFRLLLACLCGACIGYERSRRLKEAGIRTHVIVCCAAALIMIISKYGFVDLIDQHNVVYNGVRGADPARIAAQVVSGVSFLGAGAIFHNKNFTRGLTTAAGIWATAGIGLTIGAGMFKIGLFATALIMFVQIIMHFFTYGLDAFVTNYLEFEVDNKKAFRETLELLKKEMKGTVTEYSTRRIRSGVTRYKIHMRTKETIEMDALDQFADGHEEILAVSLKYL